MATEVQARATPARMTSYDICRFLAFLAMIVLYRFRWRGGGNVPASGPLLVIANHQSYLDPPMVGCACGTRRLDFMARRGLFTNKFFGGLIRSLNAMPVSEDGADTGAIKETLRRLGEGRAVVVFPEGSRSPDGCMTEFKRGVAVLVKRAHCPVICAGVDGAYDAYGRGKRPRLFGGRVALVYGTPIASDELMAGGADAGMDRLFREVDRLRLEARALLRAQSCGAYPPPGPQDEPAATA